MSELVLGILATPHTGFRVMRETGQLHRLVDGYLRRYLETFDQIYYFSYLDENLDEFDLPSDVRQRVRLFPKRIRISDWLYGILMPFVYYGGFRQCRVFRVFQALGCLPLLGCRLYSTPKSLVTFGYRYAEFVKRLGEGGFKAWFYGCLERLAGRLGTLLLATVPSVAARLRRRGLRVVLVPNGVDLLQFPPKVSGAPSPEPVLLFAGRLEKQKNLGCLLEAAGELRKTLPARLILVGGGAERPALESLAKERGLPAQFTGPVPHQDLPAWYAKADVFILPSWIEGQPKTLLEAMASALPCVVSDCEENRQLIEDGHNGFLFDPARPATLVEVLRRLLGNPSLMTRTGAAARETIVRRHDLRKNVERETAILKELALETAGERLMSLCSDKNL
jgi:glycosyltransferase involved in cell wall biosynthesis